MDFKYEIGKVDNTEIYHFRCNFQFLHIFSDWELSVSKKIWKNQGSKSGTNHSDSKWEIQTPRGRIWNCKGSRVCPSGYKRAFGSAEYLFETEIHAKTTILCPTYLIIRKAELLLRGIIKLWKYTHNISSTESHGKVRFERALQRWLRFCRKT